MHRQWCNLQRVPKKHKYLKHGFHIGHYSVTNYYKPGDVHGILWAYVICVPSRSSKIRLKSPHFVLRCLWIVSLDVQVRISERKCVVGVIWPLYILPQVESDAAHHGDLFYPSDY